MPSDLRPATREAALFAIARALNSRHGHEIAATIAAEVVLAKMEQHGLVVMQQPPAASHGSHPRAEARRSNESGSDKTPETTKNPAPADAEAGP